MNRRAGLAAAAAVTAVLASAATLVALTLRQPTVETYAPTPPAPREAGPTLVGPVLYTVDATAPDRWRYFSFRLGAVIETAGAADWDLAFRRYAIIANGGRGFGGRGGLLDLGETVFDAVREVPATGYRENEGGGEPRNPAIAAWYRYGFFSHVLTPKRRVWAVRTADGRYAKLEIVGYYCPGSQPGCLTFRYVYQGDGSRVVDVSQSSPRPKSSGGIPDVTHKLSTSARVSRASSRIGGNSTSWALSPSPRRR